MIIFLLTRYANDFYLCGNVGSALLHLTQFVLIVSSSDTETALGYIHISFSLRTQRTRLTSEQIWAQTKLQSHISSYCKCHTLASFPMSLSLFWIWRKSEQRKKGSKTTAQGVYRLLDDLRSCYEAVCGFSLGARLWVQPAACCGEAAKPKFTFVCACRCRWAQSWEELSITGVSGSMPDTRVSNRWEMWSFKKSLKKNGTFVWEGCFLKRERPEWRLFPWLSSRQLVFLWWLFPTKPFIDKETLFKLN